MSSTVPVLAVPGMRAMTFCIRPANTCPKSARATPPSCTWDATPSSASRA